METDTHRATAAGYAEALRALPRYRLSGKVEAVRAPVVEIVGITPFLSVGDRLVLRGAGGATVAAEVAGFRGRVASAVPLGGLEGIGPTTQAVAHFPSRPAALAVADAWLGRVIDPLGRPLDGRGALASGAPRRTRAAPPGPMQRCGLGPPVDLGVRALNAFTTCRQGQRLGLFAGSGVGKSTLLGMLARRVACDVTVVAMVGERGREVRPFVEETLGPDAARRATVVVATSDAPPMLRREALYAATTIAEHFRDAGRSVLLLVDSLTRFCQALREVALALGEIPGRGGWPPSVFAELPCLLERAGPGTKQGAAITGLYTVLVDGDDQDEPVADAVRGLIDGHVWLDRRIAERGRLPAVDVVRSLSRAAHDVLGPEERALAAAGRATLSKAAEAADLVRLGVYARGQDPDTDRALDLAPRLEAWLRQPPDEHAPLDGVFEALRTVLGPAAP